MARETKWLKITCHKRKNIERVDKFKEIERKKGK